MTDPRSTGPYDPTTEPEAFRAWQAGRKAGAEELDAACAIATANERVRIRRRLVAIVAEGYGLDVLLNTIFAL
jgi:hypothetical protein